MTDADNRVIPVWTLTTKHTTALPDVISGDVMTPTRLAELRSVLAALADSPIATLGSIASIAFAAELARLRSWIDPFSSTPKDGHLVGGHSPQDNE